MYASCPTVSLVIIVEHLSAKGQIFPSESGEDQNGAKRTVNIDFN